MTSSTCERPKPDPTSKAKDAQDCQFTLNLEVCAPLGLMALKARLAGTDRPGPKARCGRLGRTCELPG